MDKNEIGKINGEINYDENQIQVLEGLEAVRKRPGMYIGTTSQRGLHHLVYEIVDNSIDEAMAGRCDRIEVVLHPDGSVSVEDNGYGVPSQIHHQAGRPTLEVVFSVLHAGGKFGGSGYKISGGLHGVGASVVNALSEWMEVDNCYEGQRYTMRFEKGQIAREFSCEGDSGGKHGLYVRFKPDPEIFTDTVEFDTDILLTRLREQAFLNAGIRIILRDERRLTEDEDDLLSKPFSMNADDPDIRRLLEAAAQASQETEGAENAESESGTAEGASSGTAESAEDAEEDAETVERLKKEIAYLSGLQRKIVIAYYIDHKKQEQIARELGIPVGTVKWHLFEAKKELKKGMGKMREASSLKYNPVRFVTRGITGSLGRKDVYDMFGSPLVQNLCYAVRDTWKTVNEIADDLGVSPVYLEDEAARLEEFGFLKKKGDKYLADFLLEEPSLDFLRLENDTYKAAADLFADELYTRLTSCCGR